MKNIAALMIVTLSVCVACNSNKNELNNVSEEVKRITSLDGKIDAVLVENGGDATTATVTKVYLCLHGQKTTMGNLHEANLVADHGQNIDIVWQANRLLVINYHEARIFKFRNFWQDERLNHRSNEVELKLCKI